ESTMPSRVNAKAAPTRAVLPALRWGSTSPRRTLRTRTAAMTTVATKRTASMARWRETPQRKLVALSRFLAVLFLALAATACTGGGGDAGPTRKPETVVAHA